MKSATLLPLVLKTVIDQCQFLGFENCVRVAIELPSSDSQLQSQVTSINKLQKRPHEKTTNPIISLSAKPLRF